MLPVEGSSVQEYQNCVWYPGGVDLGQEARYDTIMAMGKFCVPDINSPNLQEGGKKVLMEFVNQFNSIFGGNFNIQKSISDIMAVRNVLFIGIATSFVLGFVYMILLRLCGGPIVYLSILLLIAASGVGGYMLYS